MLEYLKIKLNKIIPKKFQTVVFRILLKTLSVKYIGKNVQCPCCESTFKDFIDYTRNSIKIDKVCFSCLSFKRHRLLWLYLKNKLNIFTENLRILHTAPEECFERIFKKSKNIQYTTVDITPGKAKVTMDITRLDFPDNHFDAILSVHVLEHILDDRKAMKEFYRVLRPGGFAILQVPIDYNRDKTYEDETITSFKDREKAFQQGDHVRIYGKDYVERLTESGFKVTVDDYVRTLDKDLVEKYCLDENELIYICKK